VVRGAGAVNARPYDAHVVARHSTFLLVRAA
jgi:hypothetical protein